MGEEAELVLEWSDAVPESDKAGDWMMEENVEAIQTERTSRHREHTSTEDCVLEDTEENVDRALPVTRNIEDEHVDIGNMDIDPG